MTAQQKTERSTFEELRDWLKEWQLNWSAARQLEASDPREIDRVLAEYAITLSDLRRARGCASEQAELLAQMMEALGVDRAAVAKSWPVVMRDLQRVCMWCAHKGRCRRDLEHGEVEGSAPSYCLNRSTLAALKASPPPPARH
jgi:bacterioferritin-associated ferredoxin